MLKQNGGTAAGAVIILICGGTITTQDVSGSLYLLRQEQLSVAAIEYPCIGDNKVSLFANVTKSPYFSIKERGVGTMSHISTYIELVNAIRDVQRFFTQGVAPKWPTLVRTTELVSLSLSLVCL